MASFPEVQILDINGAQVLRYLRLDDGQYFGGVTHSEYVKELPWAYGPHVFVTTAGLLELIANIARDKQAPAGYPGSGYVLRGTGPAQGTGLARHGYQPIGRQMDADQIADALSCTADEVRKHYDRIVLVPEGKSDG